MSALINAEITADPTLEVMWEISLKFSNPNWICKAILMINDTTDDVARKLRDLADLVEGHLERGETPWAALYRLVEETHERGDTP